MNGQITPAQTFNKFGKDEIMLQEYVPGCGWTDSCVCSDRKDAKDRAKEYLSEGIQTRVVYRKVLNKDIYLVSALVAYCKVYFKASCGYWPKTVDVLKKNGVRKFKLNQEEIFEILGNDKDLITL